MADGLLELALVLTTAGSEEEAKTLARALVQEGLAACVTSVPRVTSTYRWKGAVLTETEHLLVIKTRNALFPRVKELVRRLHSYELPELIQLPLSGGEEGYLAWLMDGTSGRPIV
jgi:periplasmic divalent cation tolerance protein